jgi:hypothetical protein
MERSGAADLDVGHGVTDQDALRGRSVEDVEGTAHGVGVRLHQLRPAGNAADDGVDQVSEVVIGECLDRGLGVVADNHNWPADVAAGV